MKLKSKQDESGNDSLSEDLGEDEYPRVSKYASRQVFSALEESELEEYVTRSLAMHFDLTYANARTLTLQYALALNETFPHKVVSRLVKSE